MVVAALSVLEITTCVRKITTYVREITACVQEILAIGRRFASGDGTLRELRLYGGEFLG